ncbi:MAG: tRNA (N(6)-L-threonylcarbamoyladenosine(37)-C(2))-methylthiotransferase MtaB [Deltaproteobacteria bacterium RIFCSPLOWO2_12_FULL_43_16]|nr:MAG: tRNA (N(6)-L-threonylcarbamoyladenosine(37)-C(2))-methylthiotransferase MtaB [Deltaproteobacteria bacterium GWA2_43_19]OGQ10833.1 MAG: tRNA (N(6)-L-threonylcarbamoyladenosine(37)-C(2))-methylthiotransferase MtaB [Deltaproteobacteria bacterium RIFCSPHIGHO2_02_FULL_43_33]OGQ59916.1 MAG: tRNA (N(6)-L-threonylcarbamoyladenosine(37)-C(2))-methylthiotransferase MtaB [Deltaproteobacteria bacterium RIFCSPLOWO2_12_FULL_43_16]HBR16675.1 tRNA (N(6)-L-threonylcarbamoyladenosine(37)-C(2))-methylthiot
MKVFITTLGCKSNQYDSSAIEAILKENNFEIANSSESADVFIINTCTVTGKADYQSRQIIRRAKVANPDAVIIVTGCYAQVSAQEVAQIEGVDYVLGNPEKERFLQYIREGKRKTPKIDVSEANKVRPLTLRASGSSGRTRANLKVQDGCNNSCSYCIIPKARGISRSLPVYDILQEIDGLVANGYKEIILTGIHLGAYGLDLDSKTNIASLIKVIDGNNYPCRFRISSLDPDEVSNELIKVIAESKTICNHLHLPLQSGDDAILNKMNRKYTGKLFAERVEKAVNSISEVSIGVDVIVGFPGEGEKEFLTTYSMLESLPIAYMHIFPFSKRKGTLAADFPNHIDARVIKERCERFRILDKIKRKGFYEKFIGKKLAVLTETSLDKETGFSTGRSRNYIPFLIKGDNKIKNTEIAVVAHKIHGDRMIGDAVR